MVKKRDADTEEGMAKHVSSYGSHVNVYWHSCQPSTFHVAPLGTKRPEKYGKLSMACLHFTPVGTEFSYTVVDGCLHNVSLFPGHHSVTIRTLRVPKRQHCNNHSSQHPFPKLHPKLIHQPKAPP